MLADRPGLRNGDEVRKLNQAVFQRLQLELKKCPPTIPQKGDVSVASKLINKRHALRSVPW